MDDMFRVQTDGFGNISIIDANREEVVRTFIVSEDISDADFLRQIANAFIALIHHPYYQEGS